MKRSEPNAPHSVDILPGTGQRLHHLGFVIASISETASDFAESLSGTWDGKIFVDPLQRVRVTFLKGPGLSDALFELIEPDAPDSPVLGFLKKGGGLHHVCYEVMFLDKHLEHIQSLGAKLVRPPMPAVAFGGRRIAWVYTKHRLLIEFLEAKR